MRLHVEDWTYAVNDAWARLLCSLAAVCGRYGQRASAWLCFGIANLVLFGINEDKRVRLTAPSRNEWQRHEDAGTR